MASVKPTLYKPERISPPGETIRDILDDIGMSQADLARRMGRPPNKINQIVQGKKEITADTALELESVLGLPASFWMNREQNYRLALSARKQHEAQLQACEMAKDFPCSEMARYGWIEKKTTWLQKYQELLRFFGTAKFNALNGAVELAPSFRKSDGKTASPQALAAWLRKGLIEAQKLERADYCEQGILANLEALRELTHHGARGLTKDLPVLAASMGLAVVFVPHLEKTYVGGAAYWQGNFPIIQLSYRGKRHDILWFNFFHELGHILLHSPKQTYLDDFSADQKPHEMQANEFAADTLIPAAAWSDFIRTGRFTKTSVKQFSRTVGIAESNIVGRLHREYIISPGSLHELFVKVPDNS